MKASRSFGRTRMIPPQSHDDKVAIANPAAHRAGGDPAALGHLVDGQEDFRLSGALDPQDLAAHVSSPCFEGGGFLDLRLRANACAACWASARIRGLRISNIARRRGSCSPVVSPGARMTGQLLPDSGGWGTQRPREAGSRPFRFAGPWMWVPRLSALIVAERHVLAVLKRNCEERKPGSLFWQSGRPIEFLPNFLTSSGADRPFAIQREQIAAEAPG